MVTEPYLSVWINAVYKDKLERFLSDVSGSPVSLSIAGDTAKKEDTESPVPLLLRRRKCGKRKILFACRS
ncbi:MAG: hypothetical protein ACLR1D_04910 [Dialister sp.]